MHPFMKNSKENGVLNYIRVLLAVSIVLSAFNPVLVAGASSVINVSISSDKVIQGDIANVVVSLENCENITGVNMTLVYDQSIVSLKSIGLNETVMAGHSVSYTDLGSGKVSISLSGLDSITTAVTPVVDVAMNGDASGTFSMELQDIEFITTDSSSPSEAVSNGEINVNSAPVLTAIGTQTINETETLTLTLTATDADNDPLTYSKIGIGSLTNNEFSWTPASGENGTYAVNFTVSDGYEEASENVTITVNVNTSPVPGNFAPVFDTIDDINATAGSLVNFTISATDADYDPLTYYNNSILPADAVFYPGNQTFVWIPSSIGTYNLNFGVDDGNGGSDSLDVMITVDNVVVANNPPVLTPIGDQSVNESELLEITLNATDIDEDSLTFTIANMPANATFDTSTGNFSWTPIDGENGTYYVTFGVTDGEDIDTEDVIITVNAENSPVSDPVYTPANPTNFVSTTGNFWVLHDWDAGNGNITDGYNVSYNGTWYNITDSKFNNTIDLKAHSWSNITVYAYNATGSELSDGIDSKVQIPNNPISINDVASSYVIDEGNTLYIDANYTDLDDDSATFDSNDTNIFADIDASGIASWETKRKDIGTHYVKLTVSDGYGSEDSQIVEITVTNVNTAPELAAIGVQSVYEGQELAFTLNGIDDDGDTLVYNVTGLPSGATLDANTGDFSWTPDYDMAGEYTANFSATDGIETVYQEAAITVENTNRAPQFPAFDEINVAENSTMTLDVGATDLDNDTLTYSCNATYGAFYAANHTFTWTPGFDDEGMHYIKFTVADKSTEDIVIVAVNVTNVNRAPIFKAIADQTVGEGNTLSFTVNATDEDGTGLTYTAVNIPSESTFDSGTGDFSWTPDYDMDGEYTANFSVSDGEVTIYQEVSITVTDTNRAPVLDYIESVSVNETELVTINLNATDPDGDNPLYYTKDSGLGNLNDNVFTWVPSYEDKGIHYINFTVTDGNLTNTQMAVIGVNNTNRAPEFNSTIGAQTIHEGEYITFTVNATDADGDDLTYSVSGDPETSTIEFTSTGINFSWTPSYTESDNYTVTFIVKDELKYSDTLKVPITVLDVNRAPHFTLNSSYEINETDTLTIDLDPYDEDTDDDVSVWINNTGNASGSLSSGVYTWDTDYYDSGTYVIEFGLSDGTITSYSNTTVTVNDVNAPPVLSAIGSQSVDEGDELTINLTATDVDGDSLTFTIANEPTNADL